MSTPTTSPSTTPARPSPSPPARCISDLSEITTQLLNEDPAIRYRCLAYTRFTNSKEDFWRCLGICEIQSKPQIFERSKQSLQQNGPLDAAYYAAHTIRILFCEKHGKSPAYKKYRDILQKSWSGSGDQEELKLLDALRRAYKLPQFNSNELPKMNGPSPIFFPSSHFKLQSEAVSSIQSEPTTPEPVQGEQTATRTPEPHMEQDQAGEDASPSTSRRRQYLVAKPPSLHIRARSNPPNQRVTSSVAEVPRKSATVEDIPPSRANIFLFGSPSPSSSDISREDEVSAISVAAGSASRELSRSQSPPSMVASLAKELTAFTFQFPLRPLTDTMPGAKSKLPTESILSQESGNSVLETPMDYAPAKNHRPDFVLDDCDKDDSISTSDPFLSKQSHFRPTPMAMMSKDDTFIEQVSREVAEDAPELYDPVVKYKKLARGPKKGTGKEMTGNVRNHLPTQIDMWIVDAIEKPAAKEGFVYVLKAPQYFEEHFPGQPQRVKIGMTTDIPVRISQLKSSCGLFDLDQVVDEHCHRHPRYYKVESLVHSELRNFRRVFRCPFPECSSKHSEWYEVPEEVAIQTVQRWRRFILLEPSPYDDDGRLTEHWRKMLKHSKLKMPGPDEKFNDHTKRNDRWNMWLQDGINETRLLKHA